MDHAPILIAEQIFEQDPQRKGQPTEIKPLLLQGIQTKDFILTIANPQR
jgi:hypothetical protein